MDGESILYIALPVVLLTGAIYVFYDVLRYMLDITLKLILIVLLGVILLILVNKVPKKYMQRLVSNIFSKDDDDDDDSEDSDGEDEDDIGSAPENESQVLINKSKSF